jgi:hypothetical protein
MKRHQKLSFTLSKFLFMQSRHMFISGMPKTHNLRITALHYNFYIRIYSLSWEMIPLHGKVHTFKALFIQKVKNIRT